MNLAIGWAAMGTGFTFFMTALGAGVVFIFKKNMGISFLQYLNEVRAAHIYQDLIHTDEPVQVLMEKNGFTNQKLFNRVFKELYGCTPLQARKG